MMIMLMLMMIMMMLMIMMMMTMVIMMMVIGSPWLETMVASRHIETTRHLVGQFATGYQHLP